MINPQLQSAVFHLLSQVKLDGNTVTCYERVPESAKYPYIRIVNVSDQDAQSRTKCSSLNESTVIVEVVSDENSTFSAQIIANEIINDVRGFISYYIDGEPVMNFDTSTDNDFNGFNNLSIVMIRINFMY